MEMEHKVFLGGTCNNSSWRENLIPNLKMNYFNPVVEDWTPECIEIEEHEKWQKCDYHLYVITPRMTGVYSIAEVMESVFIKEGHTIFCVLNPDEEGNSFDEGQKRSLSAVETKVENHGGKIFHSLEEVANFLNNV